MEKTGKNDPAELLKLLAYEAVFDNGRPVKVQYDTLRYISTWKSLTDDRDLCKNVHRPAGNGICHILLFELQNRMFIPVIRCPKRLVPVPGHG